jgi:hypothetical protein
LEKDGNALERHESGGTLFSLVRSDGAVRFQPYTVQTITPIASIFGTKVGNVERDNRAFVFWKKIETPWRAMDREVPWFLGALSLNFLA